MTTARTICPHCGARRRREAGAVVCGCDRTGVRCPRADCGGEVLYNGNYFCERWAYLHPPRALEPDECDWALGAIDEWEARELYGGVLDPADVRVWAELGVRYPRLRRYLEERETEEDA